MGKYCLISIGVILIGIFAGCDPQSSKSENSIDTSEYMKKIWILNSTLNNEKDEKMMFVTNLRI